MQEQTPTPQINVSKIPGGGGTAGALFAIISMAIFLIGIPALRYFLVAAIALGCVVSLVIHFIRRETPGQPWILADHRKIDHDGSQDQPQNPSTHRASIYRPFESPAVS